ncbi:HNH endonuclease family protein [Acetobacteraceae bacterium ESL0709]|nr:HNH endonuclease family protein [Acetobacteraceae bacterium ESL0697]MDF7678610.1 HNH endonuclease family protein [Acetobacteraceae bacterium ESL0709]
MTLRINRLVRLNIPSSVYPFLLPLLLAYKSEKVSEKAAIDAIDVIESFLFRRAVVGIEPTGLHAVFKGLWKELAGDDDSIELDLKLKTDLIMSKIASRTTVSWPKSPDFTSSIMQGPLYRRKIANYAIREYEASLDEECPSDISDIEHIAPQKMNREWAKSIPEDYEKIIHTWGNLVPISKEMNSTASAKPFSEKREGYINSKFASVRRLASLDSWGTEDILRRSKSIAEWACKRWPY